MQLWKMDMTWREKSALLGERYFLAVGPLVVIMAVSSRSHAQLSAPLAWLAALLLFSLTANYLFWRVSKRRNGPSARKAR